MNVLSAILGAALIAGVALSGFNYINSGAYKNREDAALAETGLQSLAAAYQSRRLAGGSSPNPSTWRAELFPAYGQEPKAPQGFSWSFGAADDGQWFCMSSSQAADRAKPFLEALKHRFSAQALEVADKCGGKAAGTGTGIAATLWVSK